MPDPGSKNSTWIKIRLILTTTYEVNVISTLIYKWRNWKNREVKQLIQSHTASECQSQSLNQVIWMVSVCLLMVCCLSDFL